jgi:hypothetical protein
MKRIGKSENETNSECVVRLLCVHSGSLGGGLLDAACWVACLAGWLLAGWRASCEFGTQAKKTVGRSQLGYFSRAEIVCFERGFRLRKDPSSSAPYPSDTFDVVHKTHSQTFDFGISWEK